MFEFNQITVIVTTRNHDKYLEKCLNRLITDRAPIKNIIVVDDGSSDKTEEILKIFSSRDQRVKWYFTNTIGVSSAVNEVENLVNTPYVCWISGDDLSIEDGIYQRLCYLLAEDADICFCIPDIIDADGNEIKNHPLYNIFKKPISDENDYFIYKLITTGNMFFAPSVMFKTSVYKKIMPLNPSYLQLQDYDCWLKACTSNFRIRVSDLAYVQYRVHDANLSSPKNNKRMQKEFSIIISDFLENLPYRYLLKYFRIIHGRSPSSYFSAMANSRDRKLFLIALFLYCHENATFRNAFEYYIEKHLSNVSFTSAIARYLNISAVKFLGD